MLNVDECSSSSTSDHAADNTVDLMNVELLSSSSVPKDNAKVSDDNVRHSHNAITMIMSSHWCSATTM